MAGFGAWSPLHTLLTFVLWAVMMVAMMVPSVAPVVLLYTRSYRLAVRDDRMVPPAGAFLMGYLMVWAAFSAIATLLQWGLERMAVLSPTMVSASPILAGMILVLAGVYQWTPLKDACLRSCRVPMDFFSRHWEPGAGGAFRMGFRHGGFCLGCCWALMALLFAGGVMNLLLVAGIALFVLMEKVVAFGPLMSRIGGTLLVVTGIGMIATA
jgi:predicted metal-binding membrane protein